MTGRFDIVPYGTHMFFLGGEMDLAAEPVVEQAVERVVRAGGPLLCDLSAVTFIDSTGIRVLLRIARALGDRGCVLLHAPEAAVLRVLELVRIEDVPNIHVETCLLVAYPETFDSWEPSADLRERFEALREQRADDTS